MSESKSLFAAVIEEHLALKRRNAHLNGQRPLSAYEVADPFDNHALFKTEASLLDRAIARLAALHSYETPAIAGWRAAATAPATAAGSGKLV